MMTRDDLYKFICDADDADPANALIAIREALAGKINHGELYARIVLGKEPQDRRPDDRTDEMPVVSEQR